MMASTQHSALSDELLLKRVQAAHAGAFDELYARYGQKMFGYFYKMLWGNKELAEDFTQDLFIKIIRHVERYDTSKTFSTWMYSIANNMCKNEYRSRETRNNLSQMKIVPLSEEARNPDMGRFKTAVHRVTANLDEEKRQLYILRFMENLTVPQIAAIIGLPEGTVKSRIFYLLKELKNQLSEYKNILTYP